MNQELTTRPGTSVNAVGINSGSGGSKIAPQNLAEVIRFSEVMCRADLALPKHLRGNQGACMAIALQALEWDMSPFAVASKSYSVNDRIAYEAQLIVAVINTRSGIEGRLKYRFEGEGGDRVCIASGKLDGEVLEVRSPKFRDIQPKNSPLWKSDPDQQHCYYTGRAWGRRHTPEVLLGVYDRDEVAAFNARDVTPPAPSLQERLAARKAEAGQEQSAPTEGFSPDHIDRETGEIRDAEFEYASDGQQSNAEPGGVPDEGDCLPSDQPSSGGISDDEGCSDGVPPEADQGPLSRYLSELKGCESRDQVADLSKSYAEAINAMDAECKRTAKAARAERLAEIEGGAS
jgi:hypothetical protein